LWQCLAAKYHFAVSEHTSDGGRLRFGVPACVTSRDRVDQVLLEWDRERPDLDFAPVGVITRLGRARTYLDAASG
jgi:hypothetical protein